MLRCYDKFVDLWATTGLCYYLSFKALVEGGAGGGRNRLAMPNYMSKFKHSLSLKVTFLHGDIQPLVSRLFRKRELILLYKAPWRFFLEVDVHNERSNAFLM